MAASARCGIGAVIGEPGRRGVIVRDRPGHGVVTPLLGTAKQADELIAAEHAQHEPGRVTLRDVSTT